MRSFLNFLDYYGIFVNVLFTLGTLFLLVGFCLVVTESSVHGILYLMTAFVLLTEVAILCKLEFLGLIFIIVYIGAVCVLMLFHIKLIKTFVHRFENFQGNKLFIPFTIIIYLIPILQIITLLMESYETTKEIMIYEDAYRFRSHSHNVLKDGFYSENSFHFNFTLWFKLMERTDTNKLLGYLIYDFHFLYLIFGGLILLVAMIGSIFLTLIARKDKKFQKLNEQIFTNISKSVFFWKNNKKK
jgi:NADH:ubiquinone oxidoreductase subunit 6 (subunit J)